MGQSKSKHERERLRALKDNGLWEAIRDGTTDDVKFLVRQGASMDGMLAWAAESGRLDMVKELIRLGVNMNDTDYYGQTALMIAAEKGRVDIVVELLRHGARVNDSSRYQETALMLAAQYDHFDMVATLIQHKADVKAKDDLGRTALFHAVLNGHVQVVPKLIRHGADVDTTDKDGQPVLVLAIKSGHADTAVKLIQLGADANVKDKNGQPALVLATQLGHAEVAVELIQHGACVTAKSHASLQSPRQCETILTLAGRTGHMAIFETLVRTGAPVNVRSDIDGETPLILVARVDNFPAVSLLIAQSNGGDRVLCFDDVQADEYPLLPGTLATMTTMCGAFTFELEPVCARMMARLHDVCSALQQQQQQQHELDVSETNAQVESMTSSSVPTDTLVAFARIVYRACRLLFDIEKKRSALSRFIASRAILRRIQDIDDELNSFARVHRLALESHTFAASDLQVNDGDEGDDMVQQVQMRFEQALRSDDALGNAHDSSNREWKRTTATLLQYELTLCRREPSEQTRASAVEDLLTRFLRFHEMKAPDVPVWFISRDDLEYHSWNSVKTGSEVKCYAGKWRGTYVTIEINNQDMFIFVTTMNKWHELSHPNVVKLFGACHIGVPKLLVYESLSDEQPLHEFLRASESNRSLTWKLLYNAALGLQHLHRRGVVHGCLRSETIVVGSDAVAKLSNVGGNRKLFHTPDRPALYWMSPELLQRYKFMRFTSASDIYAFGMCIWEAVTLKMPCEGVQFTTIKSRIKGGRLPSRPAGMRDSEYELICEMCAREPSKRVDIAHVVRRLKQYVLECEQVASDVSTSVNPSSSSGAMQTKRVDEHEFVELGYRTIPNALDMVKTRCEKLPDAQWIVTHVLPALEFAFALLQERKKTSGDAEVVAFCAALGRLLRFVRTAVSNKSVYQQMRSRKVAESHHLVYIELDQLLDMLHVPVEDAIRVWRLDEASSIVSSDMLAEGGGERAEFDSVTGTEATAGVDAANYNRNQPTKPGQSPSNAISLNHFDTSPAIYEQWTHEGLVKAAASESSTWRPKWYISLRELVFSKANQIGQGAFGAVYKGYWGDAQVVIKFMGYEDDIDTISTDLLLHEVRVWHRLNHPHVLKLFGACHVNKRYFVCELASNGELLAFLKQPGNAHLSWHKLHEAALGLQYLHSLGIAHNDLKCDNIMVDTDGRAKLIDFGLSCLLGEAEIQIAVKNMGAANWRSPEYLAGDRPSCASDVYSFAMCIIEVVSDELPWGKNMVPAMLRYQWKKGTTTPPLPASMTAKQRNLIELMAKVEPSERVGMAFVVNKLGEIAHDESAS